MVLCQNQPKIPSGILIVSWNKHVGINVVNKTDDAVSAVMLELTWTDAISSELDEMIAYVSDKDTSNKTTEPIDKVDANNNGVELLDESNTAEEVVFSSLETP